VRKKLISLLLFGAAVVIVVAVLKVANWLPTLVQEGAMKKYGSIEEVKAKLGVKDVFVPSYFPQNLKWPPSRILAQSRPYFALLMEFSISGSSDVSLFISQVASGGPVPEEKLKLAQVKEKATSPLKGRSTTLEVGTCRDEVPCSRISWDEGKYRLTLTMKGPPFDLIKIADSMID
jgi:hypothetical protein